MIKEVTEAEKEKYVRGFKRCTLTLREYAEKMQINANELKRWLKEDKGEALFGKIEMSKIKKEEKIPSNKTAIKFESETIKIELKENYDKTLLVNLMEVLINVK